MSGGDTKALTGANRRRERLRYWFDQSDLAKELPPFAPTIIDDICEAMVNEGHSFTKIVQEKLVPGVPNLSTLYRWRMSEPRIEHAIQTARRIQAETKWDRLQDDIEEELNAAASGDKVFAGAISKKMTLLRDYREKEIHARINTYSPHKDGSAIALSTDGGKTKVVVVPSKVVGGNLPELASNGKELPPPRKRGLVVNVPSKEVTDDD